jgi:hypothetical protein
MKIFALAFALACTLAPAAGAQEPSSGQPPDEAQPADANINDRYVLASVDVSGIATSRVSQALRDDMKALAGLRLDAPEVADVEKRLAAEFPEYDVARRISRGDEPGQLHLDLELTRREDRGPLRFETLGSKLVYHSDLAWGGALDIAMGGPNHRVTLGILTGDDDGRPEEVTGVGVRVESRNLGTERLGFSFEVGRHRQRWDPATLSAIDGSSGIPEAYRKRLYVEPIARAGLALGLHVRAGVSLSELESLSRSPDTSFAGAAVAGVGFDREWRSDAWRHVIGASYEVRAGTAQLESDLDYTRHAIRAGYGVSSGPRRISASFMFGRTRGATPIFERFTLGDTTTLRGWSKLDVAPAGGERMFHQSVNYGYRGFSVFLDTGSVADRTGDWQVRTSAGLGYLAGPFFMQIGFPLNAGDVRAAFLMGTRVSIWRF